VKKPGWTSFQGVVGRYGTNYVARAATARIAIGANPPEDAVYMSSEADGSGHSLRGSIGYKMHFDASQLPPVPAFRSVTAYDEGGYFIANPIKRYAIGDRDKLRFKSGRFSRSLYSERRPGSGSRIELAAGRPRPLQPDDPFILAQGRDPQRGVASTCTRKRAVMLLGNLPRRHHELTGTRTPPAHDL